MPRDKTAFAQSKTGHQTGLLPNASEPRWSSLKIRVHLRASVVSNELFRLKNRTDSNMTRLAARLALR
jgi:hypothetical protein